MIKKIVHQNTSKESSNKSNEPLGLFFIFCFIFGLVSFMVYSTLFIKTANIKEQTINKIDSNLKFCNNTLTLKDSNEDILMIRFIPVVGHDIMAVNSLYMQLPDVDNSELDTFYQTRKQHLLSFWIGETPVTERLYYYILLGELSPTIDKEYDTYALHTKQEWDFFKQKLEEKTGRSFRWPTYNEWEYAALGGLDGHGFIFAGSNDIDEVALYRDNHRNSTYLNGKLKKCNELGIFDMSGCVWEFVNTTSYELFPMLKRHQGISPLYENRLLLKGGSDTSKAEECAIRYYGKYYDSTTKVGARLILCTEKEHPDTLFVRITN